MVAKAQDTRFQNLTIDYQQLMRLSPAKRSSLLDSVDGRSLLSFLTAEQLQAAFPYDKSINSDKLKNLMTGEGAKAQPGDSSGVDAKVKDKVTGRNSKTDPKAEAQLSKEQQETLDLLQKGQISIDDPRVAFLKQISDDDLKKFGINKVTAEDGKQSFRMDPTKASQMSDEELKLEAVQGKYRPVYKPGEADLSDAVINVIAGEARLGDPKSVDAVIHNMMNRVGTTGWGPSGNLKEVATAPGQYAGRGRPTPQQAEMIRNRIKEISTGNVPDPTNGANEFRTTGYAEGAGAGKDFSKRKQQYGGTDVGGNTFVYNPSVKPGPYAPHSQTGRTGVLAGQDPSAEDIQNARGRLSNEEIKQRYQGLAGILGTQNAGRQTAGSQTGGAISDNLKLSGGAAERGHDESLGKMNPELRARLAAAIADLPEGMRENVKIGSGYRDPNDPRIQELYRQHQRSGSTRPMANPHNSRHGHNEGEGGAADIEGLPKDPQSLKIIRETFDKHGLHAPVRGEGFGDGGMPHVQMKPGATESRQYAQEQQQQSQPQQQAQTAPGPRNAVIAMGSNDFSDPRNVYANTIEQIRKAKEAGLNPVIIAPNPNGKTGAAHAEVARAAQDAGAKLEIPQAWSRDGVHPSSGEYNRLGTQYKGSTFSGDSIAVGIGQQSGLKTQRDENNRTYLLDENGQRTARVGAPTSEIASRYGNFPQQQQAQPQQQAQVEEEPSPIIRNFPDGGEMQTGADQLQVYALDKNKLQRDDSIALDGDGKPQFTMNSKESMKFDPNTGRVEVDNGSKGYRNDPNQLGPEPKEQPQQSEKKQEQQKSADESKTVDAQMREVPRPMPTSNDTGHNSMYETVNLTDNIFKTPSFQRAIARSRFQNSGDSALGGHFDGGQAAYGVV